MTIDNKSRGLVNEIIQTHRVDYDSFDQNSDSWFCRAPGCSRWYRSEAEGLRNVAELIDEAQGPALHGPDLGEVSRLTIVIDSQRTLEKWGLTDVELHIQDNGRTLKVFSRTAEQQPWSLDALQAFKTAWPNPIFPVEYQFPTEDRDDPDVTMIEGQPFRGVHSEDRCAGQVCVVHNPLDHHMREWKLHWRDDRAIFERICPHGIGHPDPSQYDFWDRMGRYAEGVHGCDGCCRG